MYRDLNPLKMKRNFTLNWNYSLVLLVLLLLGVNVNSIAQPEYYFRNCTLEVGVDREVGAQYRFPNVKTGYDALVSIDFISNDIRIVDFDDNRNGGFDEAFQPRILAKPFTTGYAEFTIQFVHAGSTTPAEMTEVPATSIDVDGSRGGSDFLSEFDEYLTPGDHLVDFDMLGTDLDIVFGSGSVTGRNRAGTEKTLIDTLAKEAMFGVIYSRVSSFTVRIGLDNQRNGATTRQRSVYFKRFFYQNSFLPIKNLLSFTGSRKNDNTVGLNWTMNAGHDYVTATIERSVDGKNFASIGQTGMQSKTYSTFSDAGNNGDASYYRLKMMEKSGKASYSTVLFIRGNSNKKIGVYPTIVQDNTNIQYQTTRAGNVSIQLFDLNGRQVMQKSVYTEAGANTIALSGLSAFSTGQYVVVLKSSDAMSTQRISVVK